MKGRPRIPVAPCSFCNKQFKRQEHLRRHLRIHTQERPYVCFCGRVFTRQDLLARHHRVSHSGETSGSGPEGQGRERSREASGAVLMPLVTDSVPENSFESQETESNAARRASRTSNATSLGNLSPPLASDNGDNHVLMQSTGVLDEPIDTRSHTRPADNIINELPVAIYGGEADSSDVGTERVQEFLDCSAFDISLLRNEPDAITAYLNGVFPPVDYQLIQLGQPTTNNYDALGSLSKTINDGRGATDGDSGIPPRFFSHTTQHQSSDLPLEVWDVNTEQHAPQRLTATDQGEIEIVEDSTAALPWAITARAYDRLSCEVELHKEALPKGFALPVRQTLSRYLASYFRGFYPHLPFLHLPSTSSDSISPALLLSLCTVGAFYGYEHPQGYALYFASRAITRQLFQKRRRDSLVRLTTSYPSYAELPASNARRPNFECQTISPPSSDLGNSSDLEILQSLVALTQLTSWVDSPLLHDALIMASQIAILVREYLQETVTAGIRQELNWQDWRREEEKRRTLYAAYIVTNLQTLSFNTPPAIPNIEMHLSLPSSAPEWKASGASAWQAARRTGSLKDQSFQQCLKQLLSGQPLDEEVSVTSFGNYVLIHGLLQQLYFERQGSFCLVSPTQSLAPATVESYAAALRAWQSSWDSALESTLDPASLYGPLGFNSTAMLRLAHIRLSVGLGSECALTCRDPELLAHAFLKVNDMVPLRCQHLETAILHCIYALRVPVRVGVAFVARTQTGQWSVQHALSNFSCALLLTQWLGNMARLTEISSMESLKDGEKRLLRMITCLVEETHLADSLGTEEDGPGRIRRLAVAAIRLWAETFKGVQVFEIVHVIGATLSLVAELLDRQDGSRSL